MRRDPFPVFFSRARVYHQKQFLRPETIHQKVVNHAAIGACKRRIMCLTVNEFCYVVGRNTINKPDRILADHPDLAHVRHVKQTGTCAAAHVFLDNASRVLHRHVPAAKIDHSSAKLSMCRIQRSLF